MNAGRLAQALSAWLGRACSASEALPPLVWPHARRRTSAPRLLGRRPLEPPARNDQPLSWRVHTNTGDVCEGPALPPPPPTQDDPPLPPTGPTMDGGTLPQPPPPRLHMQCCCRQAAPLLRRGAAKPSATPRRLGDIPLAGSKGSTLVPAGGLFEYLAGVVRELLAEVAPPSSDLQPAPSPPLGGHPPLRPLPRRRQHELRRGSQANPCSSTQGGKPICWPLVLLGEDNAGWRAARSALWEASTEET